MYDEGYDAGNDSERLDVSGLDPDTTDVDGAGCSADESAGESSRRRNLARRRRWALSHCHTDDTTSGAEGPSTADEAWHPPAQQQPRQHRASSDSWRAVRRSADAIKAPSAVPSAAVWPGAPELQAGGLPSVSAVLDGCAAGGAAAADESYQTESEAGELTGVDGEMDEGPCEPAAPAAEVPHADGGWFRRPMLWAGVKRGIRRRAAQELV